MAAVEALPSVPHGGGGSKVVQAKRQTTTGKKRAAGKASAKNGAAKPAPTKRARNGVTPKPPANKPVFDDSSDDDDDDSSDNDDSSDDDDSSSEDSSDDEEEEGGSIATALNFKVPSKAKPKAKAASPKKAAPKASPAPAPVAAPPPDPAPPTTYDMLMTPRAQLTSGAIDEMIPHVLKRARPNNDGAVLVISSMNMQVVLSRLAHRRTEVNKVNAPSLLGVTEDQLMRAQVICFVVHGPHTEVERDAYKRYQNQDRDNYHWSLACWFRGHNRVFHYDSHTLINESRCSEVVGAMRHLGILPREIEDFTMPVFYPNQQQEWECGYFVLIALTIIAESEMPIPITEKDITESYATWYTTLVSRGISAPFIARLREFLSA